MWCTALDFFFDCLYAPFPLFPLVGGYCKGLLCRAGIDMHALMVTLRLLSSSTRATLSTPSGQLSLLFQTVLVFLISQVTLATFFVLFKRYQTILPYDSRLKIETVCRQFATERNACWTLRGLLGPPRLGSAFSSSSCLLFSSQLLGQTLRADEPTFSG